MNNFIRPPREAMCGNAWLTVDGEQLAQNIHILKKSVDRPVLASIKANGYGHGAELAARAFVKGGATYLGVARLAEGAFLREAGIEAPILVIGGLLAEEMRDATRFGLEFFVWRPEHLTILRQLGGAINPVKVHVKVDTGMGRLGCLPKDALAIMRELRQLPGIEIVGLATHFAAADGEGSATAQQIAIFDEIITVLSENNMRPSLVHAANSAGALYHPKGHYDMVRIGITAYGEPPAEGLSVPAGIHPALTWSARIVDTKIIPQGHGVSYGAYYRAASPQRIGVIPLGYGDGYRRVIGVNSVLLDGQERKIVGQICMDHCMIDLEGFGDITGTEVVMLGRHHGYEITATELAQRWGTISYEVLTGIAARVPRRLKGA